MPSSRSFRIAIAVKLFVIEAMRNTVSASTGAFDADVAEARRARVRELAVDDDAPRGAGDVALRHEVVDQAIDLGKGGGKLRAIGLLCGRGRRQHEQTITKMMLQVRVMADSIAICRRSVGFSRTVTGRLMAELARKTKMRGTTSQGGTR